MGKKSITLFCIGPIGILVSKKSKTFTTTKVARDSVARFSSVPSLEESKGAAVPKSRSWCRVVVVAVDPASRGEKCRVESPDLLCLAKGPSVCETKHLSYRGLRRRKGAEEGGLKRREGFFGRRQRRVSRKKEKSVGAFPITCKYFVQLFSWYQGYWIFFFMES